MIKIGLHQSRATGLRYCVTAVANGIVFFHRFGGNVPSVMAAADFSRRFIRIDPN